MEGPHDAVLVESLGYEVGSWRDGPVGSDVPVTAVMLEFKINPVAMGQQILASNMRDPIGMGVRIKSRGELERLVSILWRHADDVWPPEPAVNEQR